MDIQEAFAHLGSRHPEARNGIMERAEEALPHYMWMWGDKKHRMGYCTGCKRTMALTGKGAPDWVMNDPYSDVPACEEDFDGPYKKSDFVAEPQHKKMGICPECGRRIEYRFESRGHKYLWDDAFLIEYQKSVIDPEHTVVMVGYHAEAGYAGCHLGYEEQFGLTGWNTGNLDPEIKLLAREICVFRSAGSEEKNGAWRFIFEEKFDVGRWVAQWRQRKFCVSGWVPRRDFCGYGGTPVIRDIPAWEEAIEGTAFEVADQIIIEDREYVDRIRVMAHVAKYPCLEYMAKMGWTYLCRQTLENGAKDTLNLRGKSPEKVLRCKKDFYAWMKGNRIEPSLSLIRAVQEAEKEKLRIGYPVLLELVKKCGVNDYYRNIDARGMRGLLNALSEYPVNREKAMRYMAKKGVRAQDYTDQMHMIKELKMEYTAEFAFPRDFAASHETLSERMKEMQSSIHDGKIAENLPGLTEYCFSALGYTMRPFINGKEIVEEGGKQHICIATYVERYAKGGTVICCIRRDEALNTPFAACEFSVKDGSLIQCRGHRNRRPEWTEAEEKQFWALFEAMREQMRKQRKNQKKGRKAA